MVEAKKVNIKLIFAFIVVVLGAADTDVEWLLVIKLRGLIIFVKFYPSKCLNFEGLFTPNRKVKLLKYVIYIYWDNYFVVILYALSRFKLKKKIDLENKSFKSNFEINM